MTEAVDEAISVDFLSNHVKHRAYPWLIHWRGRRYMVNKVGLHHVVRDGRTLFHVFSVIAGGTFFKLQFNTETLNWRLLEAGWAD